MCTFECVHLLAFPSHVQNTSTLRIVSIQYGHFPYRGWLRNPSQVGRGFKPFFVLPTGNLGLASTLPPVKSVYYRNTTCIKNIKEPYSKNLPHIHRCMTKSIKIRSKKTAEIRETGGSVPFFAMMPDARGVYDPENQGVIAKRQLRRLLLDCVPQAEKSQAGRPDPKRGFGL